MKHRYKFKEGKFSKNLNNDNKNIIENEYKYTEQNLNSDKENKNKKFYENFLTEQEKEEILGGKHHRNESKKDIESLIKNDKNANKKTAELNIEKKKIMINRLTNMIRMLIVRFLKNYKISITKDDYLDEKKKIEIKILKSENLSLNALKNENEKKKKKLIIKEYTKLLI